MKHMLEILNSEKDEEVNEVKLENIFKSDQHGKRQLIRSH